MNSAEMTSTEIRCQRLGCSGRIVDGACEDCGKPPIGQSLLKELGAGASATVGTSAATRGASGTRRGSRSARTTVTTRSRLVGGLMSLPPLPSTDPLKLVMERPEVPAAKRFCPHCEQKVNRDEGFCPHCGKPYNFKASLKPGDIVGGQFEVKGPIAFGGMGWIYLAWDTVLNRWVVLKGLLNAKDEEAAAAAVAERQFLAAVKNPRIVGIYNFVTHGAEGFIVMEYVGGRTIKSLRKEGGPLPVPEALAYILGILPAFAYLHAQGIAYCDFKPDNFMLEEGDVKLIDMGGVRRIDAEGGPTRSPICIRSAARSPTSSWISSQLVPTSLRCRPRPSSRCWLRTRPLSAAAAGDAPRPGPALSDRRRDGRSALWRAARDRRAEGGAEAGREPSLHWRPADRRRRCRGHRRAARPSVAGAQVDANDPAANLILAAAINRPEKRVVALRDIAKRRPDSTEAMLRLAEALVAVAPDGAVPDEAFALLDTVEAEDQFDWRAHWYRGQALLEAGAADKARPLFDRVYFELPGEVAPKLAIALAAEAEADTGTAASFYDRVSRVDPDHTSACFGLARVLAKTSERDAIIDAAQALRRVPAASSLYSQAQIRLADLLIEDGVKFDQSLLEQAAETIEQIGIEGGIVHQLAGRLFVAAIELIENGKLKDGRDRTLLGSPLAITDLRLAAERRYRSCAHLAEDAPEKIHWVDLANRVRPVTLF